VAYLAAKSGAQILPVGIWGAQTLMLEDRVRNGRPRVEIQVGWPFEFETRTDRLTSEALDQMGDSLMRRIALLLPERLRGVYATPKAEAASG
jgi:hypothetical protein